MGRTGINSRFFNTTVTVERRTLGVDGAGDVTEIWNSIAENLPATIQSISVKEQTNMDAGTEYTADKVAYIPLDIALIKENDRITDSETGKVFTVVKVLEFRAANIAVTVGHHYKLYLELPIKDKS